MKIYVASKWEERHEVKDLMCSLIARGHEITCDWTNHNYGDAGYPVQYAQDDVTGVLEADIFIGLFINEHNYRGALIEMGVALGSNSPVYIVGHAIDSCMFTHHPYVLMFNTVDDLLKWMGT